jgi:aryl-alcohol dehydrogenase-like predicted oxidoreductase
MAIQRRLGQTDIDVTSVAMGCWPITGITSVDVNEAASLATLQAALDAGINFFDTAYAYGYEGESERLIARALGQRRHETVLASKCGLHWENRKQARDARPETIHRECRESLRRLQTDRIDLYYLHAPDPQVPLADSAGAFLELLDAGLIRAAGVSNLTGVEQFEEFHAVCPISASQPHYNMLQREIESEQLPWCRKHGVAVCVYWPLMKGFLAGKLPRDHQWDPKDGRQKYPVFQGAEWDRTHDFLDALRPIAAESQITLAQLVVAWTIQRPGITAALCGAKRPEQIRETAAAMSVRLSVEQLGRIDAAIAARGELPSRPAVT